MKQFICIFLALVLLCSCNANINTNGENALEDTMEEEKSLKEFHSDIGKATYQIMLEEIPSYAKTCTELNIEDFIPEVLVLNSSLSYDSLYDYNDSETNGNVTCRIEFYDSQKEAQERFIVAINSIQDFSAPSVNNVYDVGDISYYLLDNNDYIFNFVFIRNNVFISIMVYRPISVPIEDIAKDIDDYILSQIQ